MTSDDRRQGWIDKWTAGEIGFHEGAANDLLVAHWPALERDRAMRVLVPLCGKAVDLRWLAERGHEVVGVELAQEAITAFFAEWGVPAQHRSVAGHPALHARGVTLVCADLFDVAAPGVGHFDAIYDRAALVAIEPSLRARYVDHLRGLSTEDAATLLITLEYPQHLVDGPPWSTEPDVVRTLFGAPRVRALASREVDAFPRLSNAGTPTITERAYAVR